MDSFRAAAVREIATAHRARTRPEVLVGCNDFSAQAAETLRLRQSRAARGRAHARCERWLNVFPVVCAHHRSVKGGVDTERFGSLAEGALVEALRPT